MRADLPGHPEPRYLALADDIAASITAGQAAGRLPPERDIARHYGVACATARRAIAVLRERGLITTRNGTGSFTAPARDEARRPPSAAEMIAFLASWLG